MHSIWATSVLLLLYMLVAFLSSRVLDLVLWCTAHQGKQLVDPFLLSVRQLKQLLETRGVSHTGYIEKQELAQLVQDSADVTKDEVASLNDSLKPGKLSSAPNSLEFTGSAHFYEQVEDTKDSVWLVQVIPASRDNNEPLLDDYTWKIIGSHLKPFAIRTGILNCNYGRRLCRSKGWFEPLLLLALPRGDKPKDRVVLKSSQFTRPQAVIEWLKEELSVRVHKISDVDELEQDWLQPAPKSDSGSDVKVLLLTHLIHPPLFLAALSIKFTGRIKFGMFTVKKEEESETIKKKVGRIPSYIVITPEGTMTYGHKTGEHFNFWSMNTFLRSVQPEINDVFLSSLLFINMVVILQILQVSVDPWWKKLACALWISISHNLILFSAWILIFGIRRWFVFTLITEELLVLTRYIWLSGLGNMLRSDCQLVYNHPYTFAASLFLFGCFGKYILNLLDLQVVSEQTAWWDMLPLDCLFRPISSSRTSRVLPPAGHLDIQLEEAGIEMLIERLAVPHFWLQSTQQSSDYIKDLPVWKLHPPVEESGEDILLRLMDGTARRSTQSSTPPNITPVNAGEDCCAICLEVYQTGDTLCGLPCSHCYHKNCLIMWLQTDNHHCPICRWPADKPHESQNNLHHH